MKKIVILGSTGSIGRSALSVIADYPTEFEVLALTGHANHALLLEQAERFNPRFIAVSDPASADALRGKTRAKIIEGEAGLLEAASLPEADFVLASIVGSAGLRPTLEAVRAGKTVGLANKESLVVAGEALMAEAGRSGARLLPVDSEHSAVFQCLNGMDGRDQRYIRKIILTASGGPFAGRSSEELSSVRPQDALRHPSWSMGRKITIDSATLMNKGLEVIEAHHLFGMGPERIEVLVHPQSIVHSMVEFIDGSVMAQMSVPDMRGAIAYAMSYPARLDSVVPSMNLAALGALTFKEPDIESFPCLGYAYDALKKGGTMPAVLNAANEVAVEAFLGGRTGFMGIPVIIKKTMELHEKDGVLGAGMDDVVSAHAWAELTARALVEEGER